MEKYRSKHIDMTAEARKKSIIDKIKYVEEDWLLKSIEKLLSGIEVESSEESNDPRKEASFSFYVGNIEDTVDIDKIKKERPLKKLDMKEFEMLADSLEWDKSIDELLEDLQ